MIDGMKQEQYLGGSVFSDFISGTDIQTSTATITTPTFTTATITTLSATNIKAGSAVLSLGSAVVTFGTAFANNRYHVVISTRDPAVPNAAGIIGTGSYAPGSFMAIGSIATATDLFNWVAIPRQG